MKKRVVLVVLLFLIFIVGCIDRSQITVPPCDESVSCDESLSVGDVDYWCRKINDEWGWHKCINCGDSTLCQSLDYEYESYPSGTVGQCGMILDVCRDNEWKRNICNPDIPWHVGKRVSAPGRKYVCTGNGWKQYDEIEETELKTYQRVLAENSNPVLPLYLFQWSHNETFLPNLPDSYSAFTSTTYDPVLDIEDNPQNLKSQYLGAGVLRREMAATPGFPLTWMDLDHNEWVFLHSTNPASLSVIKGNNELILFWENDDRLDSIDNAKYRIYSLTKSSAFDEHESQIWRQWWLDEQWQMRGEVSATAHANSYTVNIDSKPGAVRCFIIKTVNSEGEEMNFSLPVCAIYNDLVNPTVHLKHITLEKTKQVNSNNVPYARVTYSFRMGIRGEFQDAKILNYKYHGGGQTCLGETCSVYHRDFRLNKTINTNRIEGGVTKAATFLQPYLLRLSGWNPRKGTETEEIVFRVKIKDKNGNWFTYPLDGGYYTSNTNNRVKNRDWDNFMANPNSEGYKDKVVEVARMMMEEGYNAIFFDEWRQEKAYIESTGYILDCPAIEFSYPVSYGETSNDPYTLALDLLAIRVRRFVPGIKIIGNVLKHFGTGSPDKVLRAAYYLDAAMYEGWGAHRKAKHLEENLKSQFELVEDALSYQPKDYPVGKYVICDPKFGETNAPNPLDLTNRMYALGTALLINNSNGRLLYGHREINPKFEEDVTILPELFIDLGEPLNHNRGRIDPDKPYLWAKYFKNGVVFVNAHSTRSYHFIASENRDLKKVRIAGSNFERDQSGAYIKGSAKVGYLDYVDVPKNTEIGLLPGSAAILLFA